MSGGYMPNKKYPLARPKRLKTLKEQEREETEDDKEYELLEEDVF